MGPKRVIASERVRNRSSSTSSKPKAGATMMPLIGIWASSSKSCTVSATSVPLYRVVFTITLNPRRVAALIASMAVAKTPSRPA